MCTLEILNNDTYCSTNKNLFTIYMIGWFAHVPTSACNNLHLVNHDSNKQNKWEEVYLLITRSKTSWVAWDFHRSKLVVVKVQSSNNSKTYFCLHFSTNSSKISQENYFLDGNNNLGHKCIANLFSHTLFTTGLEDDFDN
jgi:hypothetical protein